MTVAQYQRVYEINNTTPDNIERLAWTVCYLFNKSEAEVNNLDPLRFMHYVCRIDKKLSAKPTRFFTIDIETDATKITLGQFVEYQHWVKNGHIESLDLIAATLLIHRTKHAEDANFIKTRPFKQVLPKVEAFISSMNGLIKSYSGLFDPEEDSEAEEKETVHPFLLQYGWIYSAKQIAEFEGVTVDQAYGLPILQAFNALAYLKAKAGYEKSKIK